MFRVFNFKQIQQEQELQLICKTVNWCILCCLKLAQLFIFLQTDAIYLNYSELNLKNDRSQPHLTATCDNI